MSTLIALGYFGLFIAAFLAATVVPFSSEIVFTTLVYNGLDAWICVAVATLGNWFGGMTCYGLGYLGKTEWIEKYLRIPKNKIDRFLKQLHKYGDWFAFFSFLPGVGDIIAVAAGFFKCNKYIVATSMLLGKFIRYVVWMYFQGMFI